MRPSQVESGVNARQALRRLIESEGVLRARDGELRGRSGKRLEWLLYTPRVTLTAEGNRLASLCLLECLEPFGPAQLATYGVTGLPLLVGATALSGGRYSGLIIRERPKGHGAMRQIDGPLCPDLPVVIVDDSLVSGNAFRAGARAIEANGLEVAGMVCLVEFTGRGGREWAESLAYRVESVFKLGRDISLAPEPDPPSFAQPPLTLPVTDGSQRCETLPELARVVAGKLLSGQALDSVPGVDGSWDTAGGAFVSFRDVATDTRLVRSGFFALDAAAPDTAASVAFAVERCVQRERSRLSSAGLSSLKVAVTCISRLEAIKLADLDAARYGLIVRSPTRPSQVGAALPNTPDRESEAQQYWECLRKAGLRPEAPHDLYRFTVTKEVQDHQPWQPYGVAAPADPFDPQFVEYLRRCVEQVIDQGDVVWASTEAPSQPWEVHGVGVSVYRDGRLLGIHVSIGSSLRGALQRAAGTAWESAGRGAETTLRREDCQLIVSVLHHRQWLGTRTTEAAARLFRPSEHAIVAQTRAGSSTVLPHIACHHGWDGAKVAQLAAEKAGAASGAGSTKWARYQVTSWLMTAERTHGMHRGFARRDSAVADVRELTAQVGGYILAEANANDGLPAYVRHPVLDTISPNGSAARVLLAMRGLAEAGSALGQADLTAAAELGASRILEALVSDHDGGGVELRLPGLRSGAAAECQALSVLAASGGAALNAPVARELFLQCCALFRADGMITRLPDGLRLATDHDVLPGLALTAVIEYDRAARGAVLPDSLDRSLDWYRRRFEKAPRWLAAGWLMQGWAVAWRVTGNSRYAEFVSAVADWTMARQLDITGAFIADSHRRTGCFNTAYLAEGIAAALAVSRERGERRREAALRRSLASALRFVSTLVIRPEDAYCMPAGEAVVGAVRDSPVDPLLRIDQSAHALRALVGALQNDMLEI